MSMPIEPTDGQLLGQWDEDDYGPTHERAVIRYGRTIWNTATLRPDALERVADKLRRAGAALPAPQVTGTIEGSIITGLSIALALVEAERDNESGKRTTSVVAASGREIPNADECAIKADASGPRGVSNAAANGGDARATRGGCARPSIPSACRYTDRPGGACWRQGKAVEMCTCHDMSEAQVNKVAPMPGGGE